MPAIFAAARFISLEYNTARSRQAASVITAFLKPPERDAKTGNIQITLAADSPKDEGDFDGLDLMLSMVMVVTDEEKEKKISDDQHFISALETLFAIASEDKKLRSTFVGKNYIPFFAEMKKNGYVDVLGYLILFINGKQDAGVWLKENDAKVKKFLAWAKAY
jgi:hypothetical protein